MDVLYSNILWRFPEKKTINFRAGSDGIIGQREAKKRVAMFTVYRIAFTRPPIGATYLKMLKSSTSDSS